jgi:hypothetical protein
VRRADAVLPPGGASDEARGGATSRRDDVSQDRLAAGAPRGAECVAFSYVFDLSDFEAGRFTATRSEHLGERSRSGWVCVARDDQQALALARQAAVVEWARPASRLPEDFTVEFVRYELERS